MDNRADNNKRLVKNTVALYCRTAIVMVVSLIVTRYLLKILGEEDYGAYNVVAGIVILFTFLNASMTQAIQRFLTVSLGKDDNNEFRRVFSMSIITQFMMIIGLIVLSEAIGVWFLNCKLKIDPERLAAANWVFQLSILTFSINFFRTPYESSVIAYEKMSFFAYASIVDAVLKLAIVFILSISPVDKLVSYAVLLLIESLLMFLVYRFYCRYKFGNCRFKYQMDRKLMVELLSFSGWSICGSTTSILTQNGVLFLLNYYVSLVANAAMGVANQVGTAVNTFIASFQTSFRPQIVKAYAQNDSAYLNSLIIRTSKISFIMVFIPTILIIINAPLILQVWLTEVPDYTVSFCRLLLVCCIIDAVTGPYNCAVMATGEIRNYQLAISVSFVLDFVLCWIFLRGGMSAHYILIFRILTRGILNMCFGLYFMQKQIMFNIKDYVVAVLKPITVFLVLFSPLIVADVVYFKGWSLFFTSCSYCCIIGGLMSYYIVLDASERNYLLSLVKRNK